MAFSNFVTNPALFRLPGGIIAKNDTVSRPLSRQSRRSPDLDLGERVANGGNMTLIIGDERMLRAGLQELLQIFGLSAITADTGSEAVCKLKAHLQEIKVVLLDTHHAGRSAVATVEALYTLKPSLRVIVCSSAETKEVVHQFAALPIAVYLRKPFETEILLEHLNALLD